MKAFFILLIIFVTSSVFASPIAEPKPETKPETKPQTKSETKNFIEDEDIRFVYQPPESPSVPCWHKRIQDLPDWTVYCEGKYHKKEFSVHLVAKKYRRSEPVATAYEVLYWVTDRVSPRKREYAGTTMNFIFDGDTVAEELRLSQMVGKGGIYSLDLTLKLKD